MCESPSSDHPTPAPPRPLDAASYLRELRERLQGADRAMLQDALEAAQAGLRREQARVAWEEPALGRDEAFRMVLARMGDPGAFADAFRARERLVAEALHPTEDEVPEGARSWPGFFAILAEPRAYTSVLYLLLTLLTGIFYLVWISVGISLSLGLLVLVVGLPLLVLFLGSLRALGVGEGRLVEALLGVRMPRRMPVLPEGITWLERTGNLFRDGYTWRAMAYLLLLLPLSLVYFTDFTTALSLSLGCLALPVVQLATGIPVTVGLHQYAHIPFLLKALLLASGLVGLVGTLHLGLGLGRLHGKLAKALLVK